jgi:hypothetical protein
LTELHDPAWQMSSGEQAAIAGLVERIDPKLAIEIGTADGACAGRLAERVPEIHCFDLSPPQLQLPDSVSLHIGDSHELLPQVLADLAQKGRNVDLVLVDGDHSPSGVRRDIEDLLDSPAIGRTAIVIHDTANERVRLGVDAVRFAAWPKVAYVHLDWIPGQLFREPGLENELWYGLGLVIVDSARTTYGDGEVFEQRYFPTAPLLAEGRAAALASDEGAAEPPQSGTPPQELDGLRWELDQTREQLDRRQEELAGLLNSTSWKLTAPLRRAKLRLARLRRRSNANRPGVG